MQKQLADQQGEYVKLGAELAAAKKHGHELECSLRAMTAEKVLSLLCIRHFAWLRPDRLLGYVAYRSSLNSMLGFSAVLMDNDALQ